jgi:membrane fusion protein, multidrug efflux system
MSWKGKVASFVGATGARFALLPPDNSTGNFIKITQRFPIRISLKHFFSDPNKPTGLFPGLSAFVKIKIS